MRPALPLLPLSLLAAPLPALAQAPTFDTAELVAPSAATGDRTGDTVAMDGARVVAGLEGRSDGGTTGAGVVVTRPRSGSTLGPGSVLSSPLPSPNGQFGLDVALGDGELVVSERATGLFGSPLRSAVHHYTDAGGTWSLAGTIACY